MICNNCDSKKIETMGKGFLFTVLLGTGSVLLFFGLIFWPVLFIAVPILLISPTAFFMPKTYKCNECNNVFKG